MIRAAVVGASGYAGAELVRILSGHPNVNLAVVTSRQYAGDRFDAVYPALNGIIPLRFQDNDPDLIGQQSDVVFLALPHQTSMEMAPVLLDAGKRVVDLSADFRFKNRDAYESRYQPHACPHLLEKAVYGLCEWNEKEISAADLIGNPGCYPTSILLPLLPLVKENLVDPLGIIADSKSGVSGAGRSASQTTHFCHANESFKAYKVGVHRHTPEMEEQIALAAGEAVSITFVPHLLPITRGMESTVYATLSPGVGEKQVHRCLMDYYVDRSFVRLLTTGQFPDTLQVKGTNFCDIGWRIDPGSGRLILMSVIDNLVKGAAGQAVQNMNLMLGLDESAGLTGVPYPL